MKDPFVSLRNRIECFLFEYLVEICLFSGLLLLLVLAFVPKFERSQIRSHLIETYRNMQNIVEALQVYTNDYPHHRYFTPTRDSYTPGYFLCPLQDNAIGSLTFLTTPIPYINRVPVDPFLKQATGNRRDQTSVVLRWMKAAGPRLDDPTEYIHIGWGSLSVGPALDFPPQYQLRVLRLIPYESAPLRQNLYHPSNGLRSMGILYYDTFGNQTKIKD